MQMAKGDRPWNREVPGIREVLLMIKSSAVRGDPEEEQAGMQFALRR